jgi:alpha-glucosidase
MAIVDRAHHDGSALYVDNPSPDLGDQVTVWARVPADAGVDKVYVRTLQDAEPHFAEAEPDRETIGERWWRTTLPVRNPVTSYRFLLHRDHGGHRWLNGTGVHIGEQTDDEDFRLTSFAPPPAWAADAVAYQIFPDRFARSGAQRDLPSWAVAAHWYDSEVVFRGPVTPKQYFGGDLGGIEANLGYVQELGPNLVYLTPFFPGRSNHRYDAQTFAAVDPLLGGDQALASLSAEAHRQGIRLMGDLTTNHTGAGHEWFAAAQANPGAPEHGFYYWEPGAPGYACWLGHPQLPKLNYTSPELWDRLITGPGSVASRWLRAPYYLDGWRVDVANMTGRYRADDFNAAIARALRQAMVAANPEALLVAEHGHDFTPELRGDGWHGVMNYSGFTKPAWSWLAPAGSEVQFLGQPQAVPRHPGGLSARVMSRFLARVPWQMASHHFNLLGSHDTPRIRTVLGDGAAVAVGAALLFTFPGIPMVFAGDEIGMQGVLGEDSRRPFPWDRPGSWDQTTLGTYRALIALRKSSDALRRGGMRWAYLGYDAIAFLRESPSERVLVLLVRAPGPDIRLDAGAIGWPGQALNLFGGAPLTIFAGQVTLPGDGPSAQVWQLQ